MSTTIEWNKEHNVHRDRNILEPGPDTKYLSPPTRTSLGNGNTRVLGKYEEGDWRVEGQIRLDGKWWIARRERLRIPPSETEYTTTGEVVKHNYGLFTGLPPLVRILLAPLYGLQIAYYCAVGKDVNLQILDSE